MEENGLALSPKEDIGSPNTEGPQEISNFPGLQLQYTKRVLVPQNGGWVYTMENKDTKAGYQEVVRIGDQN